MDLRYGLRVLRNSPGFTLAAAVVLALGIGANTALFSVADAFLFKPLPFRELNRLAAIMEIRGGTIDDWSGAAPANFLDWKQQSHSFESMAACDWRKASLTGAGEPEKVQAALVSMEFFPLIGIEPLLGRSFVAGEDQPGHNAVAVLSRGLWERRFGADPNIAGKTVKLDGRDCTIAGVMPKQFLFPMGAELWLPLALSPSERTDRISRRLQVFGRLRPGATLAGARAEFDTLARRIAAAYPDANRGWSVKVAPLAETVVGSITRQYTFLLLGAVGFVLLIACANVANLQFARASTRLREIAVRAALGGSRWRIVRQLLTESVLVSLLGAAGGLLLGAWGIRLILANMPPDVARWIAGWNEIRLDLRALGVTLAAGVFTGIASGLAPAWYASRTDINAALKETGRSSAGRSRQRLRSFLVVFEMALALVLLAGAGLTVKGLRSLIDLNRGFEPDTLLTMRMTLPETRYALPHQRAAFYDSVLDGVAALPGVRSAALVNAIPFSPAGWETQPLTVEGQAPDDAASIRMAQVQTISPDYFATMRIPLRSGRAFNRQDGAGTESVAVVSEGLVRRWLGPGDPAGKRVRLGRGASDPWFTVVGVAADVRQYWIERDPLPTVYVPHRQAPAMATGLCLRTAGDPLQFARAVKARIAAADPYQPVFEVKTLRTVIAESTVGLAYVAVTMAILGAIALVLASVGIYSVMAFSVTERTQEIGVRVALGAGRGQIVRMVLRHGAALAGTAIAIGLPAAFLLARLLAGVLFGVNANDPAVFGGITVSLAAVALLACYIPGRRAASLSPVRALRAE